MSYQTPMKASERLQQIVEAIRDYGPEHQDGRIKCPAHIFDDTYPTIASKLQGLSAAAARQWMRDELALRTAEQLIAQAQI